MTQTAQTIKHKGYIGGDVFQHPPGHNGLRLVTLYKGANLEDKVRCDTARAAGEYFRAFCKIARNY